MAVDAGPQQGNPTLPEAPTTAYVPAPDGEAESTPAGPGSPRKAAAGEGGPEHVNTPAPAPAPLAVAPLDDDPFAAAMETPLEPAGGEIAAAASMFADAPAPPRPAADGAGDPDRADEASRALETPKPTTARRDRLFGSSRRFFAFTVTFVALLGLLTYTGYRTSLRMTGGATISSQQRSPSEPGYEAAVKPTPVTFLALTTEEGSMRSIVVVAQGTGETGGTLITIPLSLLLESSDGKARTPNFIDAEDGIDEVQTELEAAIGFGMTDQIILKESEIGALLEGGELALTNPERLLVDFGGTLVPQFEAGEITLDANGVLGYLDYLGPEESEYNRLNRQQLAYEALLARAASGLEVNGSDSAEAAAELLTAVGSGDSTVMQLPVEEGRIGGRDDGGEGSGVSFTSPDSEAIDAVLGTVVPFPISGFPGQRLGVKLLNGTSVDQLELKFASDVVEAGAEVKVVGNAKELGQASTTVELAQDASDLEREQATELAQALDAELIDGDETGQEIRAIVTVGEDQA